jgi:hypothetical protein
MSIPVTLSASIITAGWLVGDSLSGNKLGLPTVYRAWHAAVAISSYSPITVVRYRQSRVGLLIPAYGSRFAKTHRLPKKKCS